MTGGFGKIKVKNFNQLVKSQIKFFVMGCLEFLRIKYISFMPVKFQDKQIIGKKWDQKRFFTQDFN